MKGWGSSVSIVSGYRLDDPGLITGRRRESFSLTSMCRQAVRPIQPPVQWVLGVFSPRVKRGRDVTLTTHPRLVPRLRMSRSYTSSPPSLMHGVAGQLCCFFFLLTGNKLSKAKDSENRE
jgi:hypothetical protein